MYIVDLHCDSLSQVSSERGLINKYNYSREYPQLQLVAEFVPRGDDAPAVRRRRLMHLLDVFVAEQARLKLVNVVSCHDLNFAVECERRAAILSVEGGGGLFADSEELNTLYRMGMRVLGLAWDSNELAASAFGDDDYGLTADGVAMVRACSERGIIIDVSHLSDRATAQVLETTAYPVIATHSNFRSVTDNRRNLTDELARRIVARGGVIGLNLYPSFLASGRAATAEDILRHADYALEHFGEGSISLGLDIDGTAGSYPLGITEDRSIHDTVVELLEKHYPVSIVERIAGANAIDFFKNNL